jgi:hypothetical protein
LKTPFSSVQMFVSCWLLWCRSLVQSICSMTHCSHFLPLLLQLKLWISSQENYPSLGIQDTLSSWASEALSFKNKLKLNDFYGAPCL